MLEIQVSGGEFFDDETGFFVNYEPVVLELEHSLLSLSKWESIWEIPFLSDKEKTVEQTLSYVSCMNLSGEVPEDVLNRLTEAQMAQISNYINAKASATWFNESQSRPSREIITSEIIYYWLVAFNIPFECENWHLSRLMTLVKVCDQKNSPQKKMSKSEAANRQRLLNQQRRAQFNTKG